VTGILEANALSMRYGRRQALTDCTLDIPSGHVVGLVGPNGAGKSTLLKLACGILSPTSGSIRVLGRTVDRSPGQLARVGFLAQDAPVYGHLTVADHLRLGAHLNPRWDQGFAERRIAELDLDPTQKAGRLSGGQRAQLALTVAAGKRPDLLILDEPVASLDPLARRGFLKQLTQSAAEHGTGVILSSHLISDLEQVCDYLIVLVASRVRLAGEVDRIMAEHISERSAFVVHTDAPSQVEGGAAKPLSLEDLVLTYLEGSGSMPGSAMRDADGAR